MTDVSAAERLVQLLERENADYRVIEHAPEGRTEIVSRMRGHDPTDAAKCMVVMVKLTKKRKTYILAVVPGGGRVDLKAIKSLKGGLYAGFASPEVAEELTGCPLGAILPFVFDERLELIVDPALFERDVIYFNAGRLDRSVALDSGDYRRILTALTPTREPAQASIGLTNGST